MSAEPYIIARWGITEAEDGFYVQEKIVGGLGHVVYGPISDHTTAEALIAERRAGFAQLAR